MRIEEIKQKLHQLLPTTEYKITDHKEESFKWAMNYQNDVQFLLEQNQRLVDALEEIVSRENAYAMISIAEEALQAYKEE